MSSNEIELTPTKPYLVRAFYDWITDNHCTPYIIVNADVRDVDVPYEYVEEGRIVLNISAAASSNLQMTNSYIEFEARFNGVLRGLYIPINAVMAIYAFENGQGMVFAEEENYVHSSNEDVLSQETDDDTPTSPDHPPKGGKPKLRIVK